LIQLLVPLRAYFVSENSHWTGQGQRFSWNMKLDDLTSHLRILATDLDTGRTWVVDPCDDLTTLQLRFMEVQPDMVLQYVHFLKDKLRSQGGLEPMIRVEAPTSLNGREFHPRIDSDVNLAAASYPSFTRAAWILGLDEGLPIGLYPENRSHSEPQRICPNDLFIYSKIIRGLRATRRAPDAEQDRLSVP